MRWLQYQIQIVLDLSTFEAVLHLKEVKQQHAPLVTLQTWRLRDITQIDAPVSRLLAGEIKFVDFFRKNRSNSKKKTQNLSNLAKIFL